MIRKIVVATWGVIIALCMLTGTVLAASWYGIMPVGGHISGADSGSLALAQIATSTPQPLADDETSAPVRSEAGQDYSLVIGAIVLVIIVIAGVIIGTRRQPPPKTPQAGD